MDQNVVKIIEWYAENELLWNQRHASYPNKQVNGHIELFKLLIINSFYRKNNQSQNKKFEDTIFKRD